MARKVYHAGKSIWFYGLKLVSRFSLWIFLLQPRLVLSRPETCGIYEMWVVLWIKSPHLISGGIQWFLIWIYEYIYIVAYCCLFVAESCPLIFGDRKAKALANFNSGLWIYVPSGILIVYLLQIRKLSPYFCDQSAKAFTCFNSAS